MIGHRRVFGLGALLAPLPVLGMLVYVVLFLEGTMGLAPLQVGLVLLVPALVGVGASPIVGKLLTPGTTRAFIVGGSILQATGILILASLESRAADDLDPDRQHRRRNRLPDGTVVDVATFDFASI